MQHRALASVVVFGGSLLTAACAGRGLSLSTGSNTPPAPALLLSCARAVAVEQGLALVTQSADTLELQAKSAVETAPADGRDIAPSYDLLTVKLSAAKRGYRMLVGSATYAMRQLRVASASGVGTSAGARAEWVGTTPSSRVALVRDEVLQQCGSVGS